MTGGGTMSDAWGTTDAARQRGALAGLRVLDLTDDLGRFATKFLAENGASVVRAARPGSAGPPMADRRVRGPGRPVQLVVRRRQAAPRPRPRPPRGPAGATRPGPPCRPRDRQRPARDVVGSWDRLPGAVRRCARARAGVAHAVRPERPPGVVALQRPRGGGDGWRVVADGAAREAAQLLGPPELRLRGLHGGDLRFGRRARRPGDGPGQPRRPLAARGRGVVAGEPLLPVLVRRPGAAAEAGPPTGLTALGGRLQGGAGEDRIGDGHAHARCPSRCCNGWPTTASPRPRTTSGSRCWT